VGAEVLRGDSESGQDVGDGGVADGVKPALYAQPGALDQVCADLVGGDVTVSAPVGSGLFDGSVQVGIAQVRGLRAESTVSVEVATGSDRAEFACLDGAAEFAPVAVDVRQFGPTAEREHVGEVEFVGGARPATLVNCRD